MPDYIKTQEGQIHSISSAEIAIECFHCGICCTWYQPQLSIEEITEMAQYLGLSVSDFIARYVIVSIIGYSLRLEERGCVFLDWEETGTRAVCSIYPYRPQACRNWKPGLSRPECQEGLSRLLPDRRILTISDLYKSPEARDKLYSTIKKR